MTTTCENAKYRMSDLQIRDYDKALSKKITSALQTDKDGRPSLDVIFGPMDMFWENASKSQVDKYGADGKSLRFPIINIQRLSNLELSSTNHRVTGIKNNLFSVKYRDSTGRLHARDYQVLYMNIPYQIDVIGDNEIILLELLQELMFLFRRDPYFTITRYWTEEGNPQSEKLVLNEDNISVFLDSSIMDNSSLETERDTGKIYRFTMNSLVEDAILTRNLSSVLVTEYEIRLEVSHPTGIETKEVITNE